MGILMMTCSVSRADERGSIKSRANSEVAADAPAQLHFAFSEIPKIDDINRV
jgi:hypothetical protein